MSQWILRIQIIVHQAFGNNLLSWIIICPFDSPPGLLINNNYPNLWPILPPFPGFDSVIKLGQRNQIESTYKTCVAVFVIILQLSEKAKQAWAREIRVQGGGGGRQEAGE